MGKRVKTTDSIDFSDSKVIAAFRLEPKLAEIVYAVAQKYCFGSVQDAVRLVVEFTLDNKSDFKAWMEKKIDSNSLIDI